MGLTWLEVVLLELGLLEVGKKGGVGREGMWMSYLEVDLGRCWKGCALKYGVRARRAGGLWKEHSKPEGGCKE